MSLTDVTLENNRIQQTTRSLTKDEKDIYKNEEHNTLRWCLLNWCWVYSILNFRWSIFLQSTEMFFVWWADVSDVQGWIRVTIIVFMSAEHFFNGRCIVPIVKSFGDPIMVWCSIYENNMGKLVKINNIIHKNVCHTILMHHGIPSGLNMIGCGLMYQQMTSSWACYQGHDQNFLVFTNSHWQVQLSHWVKDFFCHCIWGNVSS